MTIANFSQHAHVFSIPAGGDTPRLIVRGRGRGIHTKVAVATAILLAAISRSSIASAGNPSEPLACGQARSLFAQHRWKEYREVIQVCNAANAANRRRPGAVVAPATPNQHAGSVAITTGATPISNAPSSKPEPPQGWLNELPAVSAIQLAITGTDASDSAIRQEATFEVLSQYIEALTGKNMITMQSMPPLAASRWRDYQQARNRAHPQLNFVSGAAARYSGDPQYRLQTLSRFVSAPSLAAYRATPQFSELVSSTQAAKAQSTKVAAAEAAFGRTQHSLAADKLAATRHKTDLSAFSVFSVPLGEQLQLPICEDSDPTKQDLMTLVVGMAGFFPGGARTCLAAPPEPISRDGGALDRMLGGPILTGNFASTTVKLAATQCPDWLIAGGSCFEFVTLEDGLVVDSVIVPGSDYETRQKVVAQLKRKYGPNPEATASVTCRNQLTGVPLADANALYWNLGGLHVTYTPFASDCKRGRIEVATETFRHAQTTAETLQPAM